MSYPRWVNNAIHSRGIVHHTYSLFRPPQSGMANGSDTYGTNLRTVSMFTSGRNIPEIYKSRWVITHPISVMVTESNALGTPKIPHGAGRPLYKAVSADVPICSFCSQWLCKSIHTSNQIQAMATSLGIFLILPWLLDVLHIGHAYLAVALRSFLSL